MPEPDVNSADDQPVDEPTKAADLAEKPKGELEQLAQRRNVPVEGTGKGGRVVKEDLVDALEPVVQLPPDPRAQGDKHALTEAAEKAASEARVRDRSAMFQTDDQE